MVIERGGIDVWEDVISQKLVQEEILISKGVRDHHVHDLKNVMSKPNFVSILHNREKKEKHKRLGG